MRKIIVLILLCNFCILTAQNNFENPPGTIQLNDSVFMDKSPITNMMFLEYLAAKKILKKKGYTTFSEFTTATNEKGFPVEFSLCLAPNPLLIDFYSNNKYLKKIGYGLEYKSLYLPVLNVSKTQAIDFCKWRTEMVSHLWKYHERHASNKNLFDKISYRLATENELILANTFFKNSNTAVEIKGNLLQLIQEKEVTQFTIYPVNEMSSSDKLFNYKSNHDYTGFRCICEMKK